MSRNKILPSSGKYKNARLSLLLVLVFSVLNIIMMFGDMYFLFSSRIATLIATMGLILKAEQGESVYLVVGVIIAIITLVPYLLSWLFSKKHVGWMIAALVLFAVDTVILLIDIPAYMKAGEMSIFADVIVHAIVLYELAVGVKAGFDMKNEEKQEESTKQILESITTLEDTSQTRELFIERKKSFVGCAMAIVVYVNGSEVCRLKNGESQNVSVPVTAFELGVAISNGYAVNKVLVASGETNVSYKLQVKMGFSSSTIEIIKNA